MIHPHRSIQEPVHVIAVGAFGEAVAKVLRELLPGVIESIPDSNNLTSPALWPVARVNILAAWRPVPRLYQLCDGISYAWKKPWIAAVLEDHLLRVGPVVIPGYGACHTCYEKRFAQHSPRQSIYQTLNKHYELHPQSGPQGYLPAVAEITAIRLAQIIAHLDAGLTDEAGRLWHLDTLSRQIASAQVIGIHDCPHCGLKRDVATRSYGPMRQELASILPWGIPETIYAPLLSQEMQSQDRSQLETVLLNNHGGH